MVTRVQAWTGKYRWWRGRTHALIALLSLLMPLTTLAACDVSLPVDSTPQQRCEAQQQGALGADGGLIIPLAAIDPTSENHTSGLYAIRSGDGTLAWSCASTTYAGWNDAHLINGTLYAIAGTESTKDAPAPTHVHAIYAIRPQDGKQLWSYSLQAGTTSKLAFDNGLLFVSAITADASTSHSNLYAIHTADGSLAWMASFSGAMGQPLIVGHRLVVSEITPTGQDLHAMREDNGAPIWTVTLDESAGNATSASPLALDGALYLAGADSISAIDQATGATRWTQQVPDPINSSLYTGSGAIIFSAGLSVFAYDEASGALRWSAALGQAPQVMETIGQTAYIVTRTSTRSPQQLVALGAKDGHLLWRRDVSTFPSLSLQPGAGEQAYLTAPTGTQLLETVIALNQRGGYRWRYNGKSPYNSGALIAGGSTLYYVWQAPQAGISVNAPTITYVTALRTEDGSMQWEVSLPALNAEPLDPLVAP